MKEFRFATHAGAYNTPVTAPDEEAAWEKLGDVLRRVTGLIATKKELKTMFKVETLK